MFPYMPHDEAPAECVWRAERNLEAMGDDFRRAERPFLNAIEQTIHTLCDTGRASSESAGVQYFLGCRSAVLESNVVGQLTESRGTNEDRR